MFNSKVIPKKLVDKGFVFKFESLKKIMTFWHSFQNGNTFEYNWLWQKKNREKRNQTLKDQISELNSQVNDEKDKFLRLFAEFENYRKRTAKERLELFKTASQELMTALLPIADDMDRALSELKKSEDAENLQGFELIYSKFNDILKNNIVRRKIDPKFIHLKYYWNSFWK